MQEVILIIASPIDDLPYVENVINCEVEGHVSQYKDEEVASYVSSYENLCHEEASYEEYDESVYSSQSEENDNTCSSLYESNINWEEESNDERNIYCLNEGMALSPKSENEIPALNSMNRHVIESFEEELSTQYENKEIIYKDELPSCVEEYHEAT